MNNYDKTIYSIIVWLPALPTENLLALLTHIQEKVSEGVDPDIFAEYLHEQKAIESGILLNPPFLQRVIDDSTNCLGGTNSGLDALCDELKTETEMLESVIKQFREECELKQAIIEKLTIQVMTYREIFELCINNNTYSTLTHVQRDAYAKVGLGILNKLFPDGLPGAPKKKTDWDYSSF